MHGRLVAECDSASHSETCLIIYALFLNMILDSVLLLDIKEVAMVWLVFFPPIASACMLSAAFFTQFQVVFHTCSMYTEINKLQFCQSAM